MRATTTTSGALFLVAAAVLAGCGSGGGSSSRALTNTGGAAKAGTTATTPTTTPGSINTLPGSSAIPFGAPPATAAVMSTTTAAATSAATTPTTSATTTPPATTTPTTTSPIGTTPVVGTPPPGLPVAAAIAPIFTGASLRGTIPGGLTTGFDGQLYFPGERLVPGSFFLVVVNGVPTKYLPATFYSSELLSSYVYLTTAADYEFIAVAPDGSQSTAARFTVAQSTPQTLFGLNPPVVSMVFPSSLDTTFSGMLWLVGDQLMPGAVATISQPGLPSYVMPLLVQNERTAGLTIPAVVAGSLTITVTNPTLLSSTARTFAVGPATVPAGTAAPSVSIPGSVQAPFLGMVHVIGQDIALGAWIELRPAGTTTTTAVSVLSRQSTAEALWTLVYPGAGQYEVRVVNPNGAASPWRAFEVLPQ
jgi:hypothetical protein